MLITVAICTWNREQILRRTLSEMCHLHVPEPHSWELLVVNNNCTDNTDDVIRSFAGRLPIRGLHESTPGKSHALNHAVGEAKGTYVLWTDDDVLVSRDWLAAYAKAFERWPDAAVFGGPISACFDPPPPRWLREALPQVRAAYGVRDFGSSPVPLSDEVVPFGANLAFRLDKQKRSLYDPALGPSPGHVVQGGEETALVRRMLGDGLSGWWIPDAPIRHVIRPDEVTTRYLWKFYYRAGYGKGLRAASNGSPRNVPSWTRSKWLQLRYQLLRPCAPASTWIEHLKLAAKTHGQRDGLLAPTESNGSD